MHLRPWKHISKDYRPLALTAGEQALFAEVACWKAVQLEDAMRRHAWHDIVNMVAFDELYPVPTLLGTCLMLGPGGRARAGLRPDNRPSVDTVMNAAYMALAVQTLIGEGWMFKRVSERGRGHYLMTDPEGRDWTVLGQARGYTSRTLRRVVRELRVPAVVRAEGILIFTPDRRATYGVVRRNAGLVQARHFKPPQLALARRRAHRERQDPLLRQTNLSLGTQPQERPAPAERRAGGRSPKVA